MFELHTLRDHVPTYKLVAYCDHCGHSASLNPMRIAQRTGWDVSVNDIRARLRCSHCHSKGAIVHRVHDGHLYRQKKAPPGS